MTDSQYRLTNRYRLIAKGDPSNWGDDCPGNLGPDPTPDDRNKAADEAFSACEAAANMAKICAHSKNKDKEGNDWIYRASRLLGWNENIVMRETPCDQQQRDASSWSGCGYGFFSPENTGNYLQLRFNGELNNLPTYELRGRCDEKVMDAFRVAAGSIGAAIAANKVSSKKRKEALDACAAARHAAKSGFNIPRPGA